jgi:hypothetical protein
VHNEALEKALGDATTQIQGLRESVSARLLELDRAQATVNRRTAELDMARKRIEEREQEIEKAGVRYKAKCVEYLMLRFKLGVMQIRCVSLENLRERIKAMEQAKVLLLKEFADERKLQEEAMETRDQRVHELRKEVETWKEEVAKQAARGASLAQQQMGSKAEQVARIKELSDKLHAAEKAKLVADAALQDEKKQLKALRAEFEARGRQVDRLKAQLAGNNGDTVE